MNAERNQVPLKARITAIATLGTAAFLAACNGEVKSESDKPTQSPGPLAETPTATTRLTRTATVTPIPTPRLPETTIPPIRARSGNSEIYQQEPGPVLKDPSLPEIGQFSQDIFTRTNEIRVSNELPPFVANEELRQAAHKYAEFVMGLYMQGEEINFGSPETHYLDGRNPSERAASEGFAGYVSENAQVDGGAGDIIPASAQDWITVWMNSEGHRANILSPGQYSLGVGCATWTRRNGSGLLMYTRFCVQDFGQEIEATPTPIPTDSSVGTTPSNP